MEFNKEKSKVMLITKKRANINKKIQIYINNRTLEQVHTLKYLGIYIDEKFNFNEHVKRITDKCTKLINILSRSAKLSWRLQQEALIPIYQGAIVPIITYGAPLWSKAITKSYNKSKIRSMQRLINIRIIKSFRTISFEASCILSGLVPLDLKIEAYVHAYNKIRHEGVVGNEITTNKSRRQDIKNEMHKICEERWQEEWSRSTKCELTKSYFPTVLSRLAVKLPCSPSLTTLLCGHGKLQSYYFRFKISETPMCICESVEQTVDHVIYMCPIYQDVRSNFINAITYSGTSWPESKSRLIEKNFNEFINFLLNIDLELIQ